MPRSRRCTKPTASRCATSRSSWRPPGATPATESLVIGAHYDSAGTAPGANDNGSGSAAVLELARLLKDVPLTDKRLRLVLFVNEEPPYDRTERWAAIATPSRCTTAARSCSA